MKIYPFGPSPSARRRRRNPSDLEGDELIAAIRAGKMAGADLQYADLTGANLGGVNLTGTDLTGANLYKANLKLAILNEANLSGADLTDADLSHSVLERATLTDADLTDANLSDAVLNGADFRGAITDGANFSGAIMPDGLKRRPPATAPQAEPRPPALSTPTTTVRPAGVYERREQIHREATSRNWKVAFRDKVDNVGPFALTNFPKKTSVYLCMAEAEYFVMNLDNPTGKEVVDALRDVQAELKAKSEALMPVFLSRMDLLENRNKTVTWTNSILPWVRQSPERTGTNPFLLGVYLLATLKRKGLIVTRPPSLADQPSAVSVPDLNFPANMFRVHEVALV